MAAGSGVAGDLDAGYGETLWAPTAESAQRAQVTSYIAWLAARGIGPAEQGTAPIPDYRALWQWSVDDPAAFWSSAWDYLGVLGDRGTGPVLAGQLPQVSWFPGATLNYARNALYRAGADDAGVAVVYRAETGREGRLTWGQLRAQVARVAGGLAGLGVGRGDRVAAYLPNCPEALIGLLATASLGAVWTSCSPDFGARSVIDRFAQVAPRVLIAADGYVYNGKRFDRRAEVASIAAGLPGLAAIVGLDYIGAGPAEGQLNWDDLAGEDPGFAEVGFGHPLWVLYSSGTTGLPKPIVHGHGGIVLEHLKALVLHQDLRAGDVFFWYTTTGWMMWNFLAGGLLAGATVVLYDGSATHPGSDALWALVAASRVSYAGFGAPYLTACAKAGLSPAREHDLTALRGVGSTGSPLPPEAFRWVYDELAPAVPGLVLGSISGGTDVCTAFVGPSPLLPVRSGIIAGPLLGAKVEAFDADGHPVTGQVGELVVTAPMPSMPVGFWNDPGGERYRAAYFAQYPGVWRHGDWVTVFADGGCVIHGRSDATLNRGGVRMGTAEFYRVVEALPQVTDSLVIDTSRAGAQGELILYVVLAQGEVLDDRLTAAIRQALRTQISPRHVPDQIRAVPGIPRTLSGKKLEVPVRKILQGTPVAAAADPDALANPEVLPYFTPQPAA